MRDTGKNRRMVEALEGDILAGRYRRGERLPAVRELMQTYGLSCGTVSRGLDYLTARGLLEKRARSGVFVRTTGLDRVASPDGSPHVTLFHACDRVLAASGGGVTMLGQAIAGIQEAAKDGKLALSVEYSPSGRFHVAPERFALANRHSEAVIMLGEFDQIYTELPFAVPAVGVLCACNFGRRMSLVNVDADDAARCACEHFESRAVATVDVLSAPSPVFWHRAERFIAAWRDRGHRVGKVRKTPYKPLTFTNGRGYFFASDSMTQYFSELHQARTGRGLAEDHVVFSVDGKGLIDPSFHRFPSYCVDWRRLGNMAAEEVLYRLQHPGSPARQICVYGTPRNC